MIEIIGSDDALARTSNTTELSTRSTGSGEMRAVNMHSNVTRRLARMQVILQL